MRSTKTTSWYYNSSKINDTENEAGLWAINLVKYNKENSGKK